MKKILSFFILFLALTIVNAQQIQLLNEANGIIRLKCSPGNPSFSTEAEFNKVWFENATPILKKGAPDLPKLNADVIVDDTRAMELQVTHAEFVDYPNMQMAPSKGNLSRLIDPSTVPFEMGEVFLTNSFYPSSQARLGDAFINGQFRGQTVHFFPVQYNPITHILRVYSSIEVEIRTTENLGSNPLPATVPAKTNALMKEVYADRFINYSNAADRYEVIDEIGSMLVIYDPEYLEALQPWITWKKEKGIEVILQDVSGINSVAAIGSFVADYYTNHGLTYLVLVGDEDQVPTELVNNSGGLGYCDPCYGYISGNDSYAELFVGRLLVHNANELVPVISKILEYEKTPNMNSDWFSVAMGIGSNEGGGIGDDNEADWQHQNNIKNDLLSFTYSSVYERYDGNHTGASPTGGVTADGSSNPSAASISSVINDGCSLINYTGHGDHSIIVTGSYTNTNINALTNTGKYPYWIIVGCCVGDFDDDSGSGDTFGEAWLKSPSSSTLTGGIGGAFSTVFQSWAPPMEGQDEMNKLISDLGPSGTRHTLGSIHVHGCASMNDAYGTAGDEMTDTWILMGDPTVQLRTAFPSNITATHVSTAFLGTSSFTIYSSNENALVCLTLDGEILGTGLIQNGQCVVSTVAITQPGSILVTLTNFNTVPYQGYIEMVPANGPFVIENSHVIDDELGNANGLADYTESLRLDVEIENIGIELAQSVVATLTTNDPNVVITSNTFNVGDVDANSTLLLNDAFAFTVNEWIEDQHEVFFTITLTDALGNAWTSYTTVLLNSPVLSCAEIEIDDSLGNSNGRLDPGETAQLIIHIANDGHAATSNVDYVLNISSPFVSTNGLGLNGPSIYAGETGSVSFELSIASDTPISEPVSFTVQSTAGLYSASCDLDAHVNQVVEDWESGTTSGFNWQGGEGAEDWFISSFEPLNGSYCMQSGDITDNQQSILRLDMNFSEAGTFGFHYKTSTESGWDLLRFRVNGATQSTWSGENQWANYEYAVSPGAYIFRWIYVKDQIQSQGADACWIDDIVFPAGTTVNVSEEKVLDESWEIYPNPGKDELNVFMDSNSNRKETIQVFDAIGNCISVKNITLSQGFNRLQWNTQNWAAGIYVIKMQDGSTQKWVKQ